MANRSPLKIDPALLELIRDEQHRLRKTEKRRITQEELLRRMWHAYESAGTGDSTEALRNNHQLSDTGSLKSSEQWHELLDVILASEQPVLISAITRTIEAFAAASGPREPISAEGISTPPASEADIARIRERARQLGERRAEAPTRSPEEEKGIA